MAAIQRPVSPRFDQVPAVDVPRTPTSLASGSNARLLGSGENPNLLHPKSSPSVRFAATDLSPKSSNPVISPARTPARLTGAGAMAEAKRRSKQSSEIGSRQTSPNPAVGAMHALMGGGGMSKATDSPTPNKLSEPLRKAADKITIPAQTQGEQYTTSPASMASFGSMDTTGAGSGMTATAVNMQEGSAPPQFTDEPGEMAESNNYPSNNGHLAVMAEDANKAFSYPGPPPSEQGREGGPSRGMSLPGVGQRSPKSPASANKRHKCPYCSTDFTRHHNLKSHLLTHSQEKPYVCQTCNARFRRLHDLKRHTKLHTGERPHNCDKCGRRFARGDALARHNKGPGGCAGRRSSATGEDDFFGREDAMDGVEYTGEDDEEADADQHGRRVSEPSRKRAHLETPHDPNRQVYRQQSSTYPPPAMQHARAGDMAPPQVVHPGSSGVTSPRDLSGQPSPAAGASMSSSYYGSAPGQVFQQQGGVMTESPKPLSPGQPPDQHRLGVTDPNANTSNRNRSPSLTTQFQQAHFGRGSGHRTPPQPPNQFLHNQNPPQLPPLPSLSSTNNQMQQARPGHQTTSYPGPGPSSLHHQQLPPQSTASGSNAGSLSSHGRSSGSSMRDILATGAPDRGGDIWDYVRNLESRLGRLQEEYELRTSRMQEEIFHLRAQVQGSASYSSEMGGVGGGMGGNGVSGQRY